MSTAARELAIPRNIDLLPPEGTEIFTTVYGTVPNDGVPHVLTAPVGQSPLIVNPNYAIRVGFVRAEWTQVDLVIPPPLTLTLLVNGSTSVETSVLESLMLQALAAGPPAIEAALYTEVRPNARVTITVTNTGSVSQLVCAYLWGWAYAQTLKDGNAYAE